MRLLYKIELLENQWHELVNDISPSASKIHCSVSYAIVTDCMLQTEERSADHPSGFKVSTRQRDLVKLSAVEEKGQWVGSLSLTAFRELCDLGKVIAPHPTPTLDLRLGLPGA